MSLNEEETLSFRFLVENGNPYRLLDQSFLYIIIVTVSQPVGQHGPDNISSENVAWGGPRDGA